MSTASTAVRPMTADGIMCGRVQVEDVIAWRLMQEGASDE